MIYADSSYLIALFDRDDHAHDVALMLRSQFLNDQHLVLATSRDALNELLAHFSRSGAIGRRQIARFVRRAFNDPKYRVEVVDEDTYANALNLYESRHDKRYSMVDCIGMTIMRRDGLDEVVTTDRDFMQEGFVNLMR